MKGAPGDQVSDLLCVQLASYLEGGPLMFMLPLHVYQKSDHEMLITLGYCLNFEGHSRVKKVKFSEFVVG